MEYTQEYEQQENSTIQKLAATENLFQKEYQVHYHHNVTSTSPQPVLLTELNTQSAFIQCPYCLQYVYTKISDGNNIYSYIAIFGITGTFYPFSMPLPCYVLVALLIYFFAFSHKTLHKCPSCKEAVATFDKSEKVVGVTAPAMSPPPPPPDA